MNRLLVGALAMLVVGCAADSASMDDSLALTGATVLLGPELEPAPDATIVIRDGLIACAGPTDRCSTGGVSEIIDGTGTWVIPGLFNAHVHVAEYSMLPHAPLFLAHGVTSVRDVGGRTDSSLVLRRRWEASPRGPNLFIAGHPIDGDPPMWPDPFPDVPLSVSSPEEARAAVREVADAGADFIKLYNGLDTASLRAATAEAHARGMRVTADLTGWSAPTAVALAADIDGLEHHVGELTLGPPRPGARRYSWEANETELTALANEMASRGVTLTVTSGLFQEGFLADSFPAAKPTFLALPPGMQERSRSWWETTRQRSRQVDDATLARIRTGFSDATCRFAMTFHEAGGQLLVGTDAFWQTMVPGDIHGELEWLVGCGLSPRETLVAATGAPARWLGADSLGVISEGRVADLVVLTADPLADIRNTRRIRQVIRRGVILEPEDVLATIDGGPP